MFGTYLSLSINSVMVSSIFFAISFSIFASSLNMLFLLYMSLSRLMLLFMSLSTVLPMLLDLSVQLFYLFWVSVSTVVNVRVSLSVILCSLCTFVFVSVLRCRFSHSYSTCG